VSFDVRPEAYTRFMGRYSEQLATLFAELAQVHGGQRVLDVGCGAGALTAELAGRLGASAVCAVDPSQTFPPAVRRRCPGVGAVRGTAERLPFGDGIFDATLAQLVVHFMTSPVAGLREMARVTRPAGMVAACVWDHAGGEGPLAAFWRSVRELDPLADDESRLAGVREGHLAQLFGQAGLTITSSTALTVRKRYATFGEWWEPFTLGVGPAGSYVASLPDQRRASLRERCEQELRPPFEISATAWAVSSRR
jgi:SAM-dependent methyltransferase